jgi:hypothetical protein
MKNFAFQDRVLERRVLEREYCNQICGYPRQTFKSSNDETDSLNQSTVTKGR